MRIDNLSPVIFEKLGPGSFVGGPVLVKMVPEATLQSFTVEPLDPMIASLNDFRKLTNDKADASDQTDQRSEQGELHRDLSL